RNAGSQPGSLIKQIQQDLHKIVRQHRASGHVNDGDTSVRLPIPAETIGQAHASRGISLHGMDSAEGSARSRSNDSPSLAGKPVDPVTSRNRLAGFGIGPEGGPVSLRLIVLVGNGALDDKNEGRQLARGSTVKVAQELVPNLVGKNRVMKVHFGDARYRAAHKILQAGLRSGRDSNGVAVTPETGGNPKHINFLDAL